MAKEIEPKFRTVRLGGYQVIEDPRLLELGGHCKHFHDEEFAPLTENGEGSYGNLGLRVGDLSVLERFLEPNVISGMDDNSFYVTLSSHRLDQSTSCDQFALVASVDLKKGLVYAVLPREGVDSSSESFLYGNLFAERPEDDAIFHGHSGLMTRNQDILLPQFKIPVTRREQPYGTKRLAREVSRVQNGYRIIQAKNHGFFVFAPTMQKARDITDTTHDRIKEYLQRN